MRVFFLVVLFPLASFAQEMPLTGGRELRLSFAAEQTWSRAAKGPNDVAYAVQDGKMSMTVPLWKNERFSTAFYANLHRLSLTEPVPISEQAFVSPTEIGTLDMGLAVKDEAFQSGKLNFSVGVNSSGEYSSLGTENHLLGANASYEVKTDGEDGWVYFLSYSQNRAFLKGLPVPGLAYSFKRDRMSGLIGLPFLFVFWRPTDTAFVTTFLSPFAASAEVSHMTKPPLMIFANTSWVPRSYQNVYRGGSKKAQFMFERKEITAGVRLMLGPQNSLSLAYVHAFDRRFVIGESIFDRDVDHANLDAAGGIQLKGKITF